MDIRKLRIFQAAAQKENFTEAAGELFMTQPAVSRAILELEQEAGTALFVRLPNRVSLTPAGRRLLKRSGELLSLYREVEKELGELEERAAVHIGSSITVANGGLPAILHRLQEHFPDATVTIEVASSSAVLEKLRENELDAAFVEGSVSEEWAACIPFSSYTIHAVCSPEFAARHPVRSLKELADLPLLLREQGSALRDKLDSLFLLHDQNPVPAWTSVNSSVLLKAAVEGFGVAFLPKMMIEKKIRQKKLEEVFLPELPLENRSWFVWRKQTRPGRLLQCLMDACRSRLDAPEQ
ncbi:MAG TPA: LysR family transcriptional regulator [Candidatus Eisenbergiella intestinipullorum]|nr:LysR family transcriptional regulator [Candidatus Eisenbergiella intestinipullorum]